jgi:E3 ubiquitin-protein ligase TRIP12
MDGHVLPLDTTIYGAVHHHEARRAVASGSSSGSGVASLSAPSLWQGVYTVKYRKVPGPPPVQPAGEFFYDFRMVHDANPYAHLSPC